MGRRLTCQEGEHLSLFSETLTTASERISQCKSVSVHLIVPASICQVYQAFVRVFHFNYDVLSFRYNVPKLAKLSKYAIPSTVHKEKYN